LIGRTVTVYVDEWQLKVYYGRELVESWPRLSGRDKHRVNYRHVIETLLRKPGGFRDYRYRADLFPRLIFRQAWEQLEEWYAPRKADLIYLRVLHLALEELVAQTERWDEIDLQQRIAYQGAPAPDLAVPAVSLADYDQLLGEVSYVIS
jgi:hypothetical protein